MLLGQLLQKALKDANVSPADAANHIGISEGSLYRLFKKDTFEVSYLKKAAEMLGLPVSYFLEDSATTPPAAVTHSGDFNIVGTGINQKVKVSKAPAQELAQQLDTCQRDNEALRRELALANALVASKDETISLLRIKFDRPN